MPRICELDDRLSRASALFPACEYGADIGADHGRLSCYLLETGTCARMCVADISADSLKKAEQLLISRGLKDRADFKVGDGLSVLDRPAGAIAILGMGGHTLSGILENGREKLCGAALILSAHTDMPLVRRTLAELNYCIETEAIAFAAHRFYCLLRAVPGREQMDEKQLFLGPRLMETKAEHYPEYLQWRIGIAAKKQSPQGKQEWIWLKEERKRVRDGENG
ncbi:MAG: SAM-dependent methyltransferase [Clostridia bacterium]|nr:SAM-dependent methyltransferase [Clostridia bacterium]